MKKAIIGLVGLNLVLAIYLSRSLTQRTEVVTPAPVDTAQPPTKAATPKNHQRKLAAQVSAAPKKFTWHSLTPADLKQYVANLRSVQCPEETVRDIIIAEVNRLFAPKERALKIKPEDYQPWETRPTQSAAVWERQSKIRELIREKRTLLKELLGVDVPMEIPTALAGKTYSKFEEAFNALPEDKRDRTRAIQELFWDRSDELKQRTLGYLEPEDREELKKIKAQRREALAQVLSSEELLDFDLKTSNTADMLRNQMAGFEPSEREFRELFKLMQPIDEELGIGRGNPDPDDSAGNEKRKQAERFLQDQVRSLLGEQRFAELERSRDGNFRNLTKIAEQNGLAKETAIQAYDIQRLARDEASKVLKSQTLTTEQRQEMINAMQTETDKALRGVLGEQGFQIFQRSGANQINTPPSRARRGG